MTRVKFDLPERFVFATEFFIRFSDINARNHLSASSIMQLTIETKQRFLKHLGFSELSVDGAGYIMTDASLVFKSQGLYGQTLKIEVGVSNFTKKSCDFIYRFTNKETGREIARVKTGVTFIDYKTQKLIEVPAKFKSLFSN